MNTKAKSMIIIADDLTGANDTSVQFASKGFHTEILLEGTPLTSTLETIVAVVNTNSRSLPPTTAYHRIREVTEQARHAGFQHYYKKLDSTLRGNLGMEVKAILDIGLHDFALVIPAFPKNGRTTVDGHHLLYGIPLAKTEFAHDPISPVIETSLPELLKKQTNGPVGHIGMATLGQGETAIIEAIQRYVDRGITLLSCDAWLDEHFELIARAAMKVSTRILWAGSAGLAECLPTLLGWKEEAPQPAPILVIAGSLSAVTRDQVGQLLKAGHELVEIRVKDYLPWHENQPLPCLEKALSLLAAGKSVILASGYATDAIKEAEALGVSLGMSLEKIHERVSQILGFMGALILNRQKVAGLILTGSDTAMAVCRALGVSTVRVVEEVTAGIPLGKIVTEKGTSLWVVTKAGSFGPPDALLLAAQKLMAKQTQE